MTMTLTHFRLGAVGIVSSLLLIALSSCTSEPEQPLPEGPQTMTGVLTPVPLSLSRRGSHLLSRAGVDVYYVESGQTDLRDYEGVDVVITGTLERNIDPEALPVLVASGVKLVDMPTRVWEVDALSLSLETPLDWAGESFDDGIQFTQSGSSGVLLKAYPSTLTRLPAGIMLQVDGRRAVRVSSSSGVRTVHVQNGRDIVTFSYAPPTGASTRQADRDFNRVLRSVRFEGVPTSSASGGAGSAGSTSSEQQGAPCGGPAGVLCPSGQYCEITDPSDGIGRCRALQR